MSKTILKLSLLLCVICAICTALVSGAFTGTKDLIAQRQEDSITAAYREVLPATGKLTHLNVPPVGQITDIMASTADGSVNGYIYSAEPKGYGGGILLMVGFSHPQGTINGVKIIRQTETPGLGAKCTQADFLGQFRDKPLTQELRLTKTHKAGDIQAITAATITSKAVISGINAARRHYADNFAKHS